MLDPEILPLQDVFNTLRKKYRWQLRLDDYLIVLKALQSGIGLENREALESLCALVWAKSESDVKLLKSLFQDKWQMLSLKNSIVDLAEESTEPNQDQLTSENQAPTFKGSKKQPTTQLRNSDRDQLPSIAQDSTLKDSKISKKQNMIQPMDQISPLSLAPLDSPVEVVRSFPQFVKDEPTSNNKLIHGYLPVTVRQMKQCWRYLRRMVREGPKVEIDLTATIDRVSREGFFLEPVTIPIRVNRVKLLILVDREGSMVPFHHLFEQVVETAQKSGKLSQSNVYYFHNCPHDYLYRHPARLEAQLMEEVFAQQGSGVVVMILSDAGAARGNLNPERVVDTAAFLEQLWQYTRYVAWINPVPQEWWEGTTAGKITGFVPMFDVSVQNLGSAVSVLRGRHTR